MISFEFFEKSARIVCIVFTENPNTPQANNSITKHTIVSIGVMGTISPYPTVVIVTVEK